MTRYLSSSRGAASSPRLEGWSYARFSWFETAQERLLTMRTEGPSPFAWIERVAQAVANQVERQHHQEYREARPQRHPWRVGQEALRCIEHAAPGWGRRLLAEAEERQRRLGNDRCRNRKRRLHQKRRHDVRQNMN